MKLFSSFHTQTRLDAQKRKRKVSKVPFFPFPFQLRRFLSSFFFSLSPAFLAFILTCGVSPKKKTMPKKRGRLFGFLFRLIDLGMRPTCMHDGEGMIQSVQPPPLPSIPRVINKTFLDPSVIGMGIPQYESYIQCSTRYIHTHSANIEQEQTLFKDLRH